MNKVLKDIVNRYKLLRGHAIKYAHDCHSFNKNDRHARAMMMMMMRMMVIGLAAAVCYH